MPGAVGVLALQGDFALHRELLASHRVDTVEVRSATDLIGLSGLVIPGGESTTIAMGIEREGLAGPIAELAEAGVPVFGTCAGMILLSRSHLGLIDIEVERNAYGRQLNSFETDVDVASIGRPPVRALFIRAPRVVEHGPQVEVLAAFEEVPVFVRQGNVSAISFHPELVGDARIHLAAIGAAVGLGAALGD